MKRFIPVSTTLLARVTLTTLAVLAMLGLAGCGGGSDTADIPARTFQSVDLPMGLTLDILTSEQRTTFCAWATNPANEATADSTQTETDPYAIQACLSAFAKYPACTVGQYDACAKAVFADPNGATPEACQAIAKCPATPALGLDMAPPSKICDGTMMPGSLRWCDADGTAKDMNTSNVWLKDADCDDLLGLKPRIPGMNWLNLGDTLNWIATLSTDHCSLLDGSVPGNWAMPSRDQFLSLRQGVEPVSVLAPRLFTVRTNQAAYYWTSTVTAQGWLYLPAMWWVGTFDSSGTLKAGGEHFTRDQLATHLPVRLTFAVTSIVSGKGYSVAPSSALSPVAGTPYFTRSYLTPDPAVNGYTAAYVGLSGWDNAVRTPRIWYFEAGTDPDNAGYYRLRYVASGGSVRYLAVIGNSIHPGASVIGWPDAGGDNRRWKPEFVDGGVMLKSKLSGLCMHIETNDGLFLRQAPCDATNKAQVFVLTPRQDG